MAMTQMDEERRRVYIGQLGLRERGEKRNIPAKISTFGQKRCRVAQKGNPLLCLTGKFAIPYGDLGAEDPFSLSRL
jgi:hypothetical protein